ncbi:MBL fold metallo-hydrolase [Paenibacillus chartarius]|uniref:MBL fold metallo-hydrolase n=1 Tax=Paenibacillus chartarius TaxID=747481 RepID=A0ABV6DQU0_9BACL
MIASTYELHTLRVVSGKLVNYCYVIVDRASRQAAVVDPAADYEAIAGKLGELRAELKLILLTHSHDDHVQLVHRLAERYAPEVRMSRKEIDYYAYSCTGLQPFDDGQRLTLGETTITCLVTPGHTYGSSCFLLAGDLLTGDTIFIEGCGLCTDRGSDAGALYDSVQRIKSLVRTDVRVHPGHAFGEPPGQPMRFLHKYNFYFQFDRKDQFVAYRMRHRDNLSLQYI